MFDSRICPRCQILVPEGATVCPKCGTSIGPDVLDGLFKSIARRIGPFWAGVAVFILIVAVFASAFVCKLLLHFALAAPKVE
jgi:hypothetical protein